MGMSVYSKGKSVQEAVKLALEQLKVSKEQVEIEIIDEGRKRMFGLGYRPALVRVTKMKSVEDVIAESLETDEEEIEQYPHTVEVEKREENAEHLAGLVWVKDGEIFCRNKPNQYPVVEVGANITLYRNQEIVKAPTIIKEEDELIVKLHEERLDTSWSIKVDTNHQSVTLDVQPGIHLMHVLKNQEPSTRIRLETEQTRIPLVQLKKQDVLSKLEELNIKHGIDESLIEQACRTEEQGSYKIVKATEPIKGKNGEVEFLFDVDEKMVGPKELENGTVDFRETTYIPTIEEGTVFAVIEPPVEGRDGKNVLGEAIPAPSVYPILVRTGKGVTFLEDEQQLVATLSGRPEIKRQGQMIRAAVLPKYVHSGDVDFSTGNIRFTGDVEIHGHVEDKMLIDADGDVLIQGNVNNALVHAGNTILIRQNVINSKVEAGKSNLVVAELGQKLGLIQEELTKITRAIEQLYQVSAFKQADTKSVGLSPLLKILLEQKFKDFKTLIRQFVNEVNRHHDILDEEWRGLAKRFKSCFLMLHPDGLQSINELEKMNRFVKHVYHISVLPPEPNASLTCAYALNSELFCSGAIHIKGKGIYNSTLHAGGKLTVEGVFVGGRAFASLGADVTSTGSKTGVSTRIRVPTHESITIKIAMEDTIIQIGNRSHKFTKEARNVYARLNDQNELLLY